MDAGAEVFDYGNSIRDEAELGGYDARLGVPRLRARLHPAALLRGQGPVPLGRALGRPGRHRRHRPAVLELFPDNEPLHRWITQAAREDRVPGPARAHLLARLRRARPGRRCASTRWSPTATLKAPIVIGRDHLDCGCVASPVPRDRGDARRLRRDRRLAAAQRARQHRVRRDVGLASTTAAASASAARIHAGQVTVADGTPLAAEKIARVLTNDPGMGVIRHVDAGYDRAVEVADERGVRIPMREGDAAARAAARDRHARSPTSASSSPATRRSATARRWASCATPRSSIEDGRVAWVGAAARCARPPTSASTSAGRAVIPGFVDSHTHLVFAGERSAEFAARMAGEPYTGGGIATTVAATRAASDDELRAERGAAPRARCARSGTTTVETKSGYGLDVADRGAPAAHRGEFTAETTFLGAHVVPPEYADDRAAYVDLVCGEMLDACAPLARWVDVFCDAGAFDAEETRAVLRAGVAAGLAAAAARQPARARPGRADRRRVRRRERRPLHVPDRRRRRGAARRRASSRRCCPAPSSRRARRTRTRGGCSTRA